MIIDGQAEFRSLLMHHVSTHWPDAIITDFDPIAGGHLPDEFSGAGNDVILLGSELGDRQGVDVVKRFKKNPNFPAVVYFGRKDEAGRSQGRSRIGTRSRRRRLFPEGRLQPRCTDRAPERHSRCTAPRVIDRLAVRRRQGGGYRAADQGLPIYKETGHLASVYLAERKATGVKMVLKVLRQIPDVNEESIAAFDRFLQEYEMIAGIDHPNIVKIYDLGVADDHAHIAMEYLDAGDLRQRISERLIAAAAVKYLREIASALARIHEVGILHRDLKPGNIMLRRDNSIALIDFGLAKRLRLQMEITGSGEIFGTPYYMSPEQGHGNPVDERSDIYSLGVIFYEMLTGQKPYHADTAMGIIYKHARAPIPLLPARLAESQALLNMMLAKDPKDRLQSVAEVEEWL
jgi:hypothetical protein